MSFRDHIIMDDLRMLWKIPVVLYKNLFKIKERTTGWVIHLKQPLHKSIIKYNGKVIPVTKVTIVADGRKGITKAYLEIVNVDVRAFPEEVNIQPIKFR
jgi:hypothetical protein